MLIPLGLYTFAVGPGRSDRGSVPDTSQPALTILRMIGPYSSRSEGHHTDVGKPAPRRSSPVTATIASSIRPRASASDTSYHRRVAFSPF